MLGEQETNSHCEGQRNQTRSPTRAAVVGTAVRKVLTGRSRRLRVGAVGRGELLSYCDQAQAGPAVLRIDLEQVLQVAERLLRLRGRPGSPEPGLFVARVELERTGKQ